MSSNILRLSIVFLIISQSLFFPGFPIVPIKIVKETQIHVNIDILLLGEDGTEKIAEMSADIPAGKRGFMAKNLKLRGEQNEADPEEVSLEIEVLADAKNQEKMIFQIGSKVTPLVSGGRMEFKRNERLEIIEGSSSLVEIYSSPKTKEKIILNVSGSIEEVETFKPAYPSTTKVLFQLNISRISGGKHILLEQNSLSSFIGQTASYYLHLYAGDKEKKKEKLSEDELDISMTPLSIADEVLEVEIKVAGRILKDGGGENPVDFKRVEMIGNALSHEVIIASEESDGVAQEGYKFEIIPTF